MEEDLKKVKGELVESQLIKVLLNTEKKKLAKDYQGFPETSRATQEAKRLEEEVKRLEDEASQHSKKLWAAVENYKQSFEFEGALIVVVESFKKSSEFLDALGVNVVYGAYSFVRKYKEKYPELRSDYEEFQEDYNSSWFADLNLDAPSEDEEDEEAAPPSSNAA
ncbi:hypothetical protein LIER_42986 [Lithospermum erythrorhizon]|uniref:Uncharacterized protein n=1 Tax=Lithospermum erythrorhizon TaxID=34254 RepID=A0AAV3P9I8_LITER